MRLSSLQTRHGFTLIEVIIAMSIFAIVSLLAYSGLNSVIQSKTHTEAALERLQELQMTMLTMANDFQSISNQNGIDALGGPLLKLTTQDSDYVISFNREGWRNPANQLRSTLQRVSYQLDDEKLRRIYWQHINRADDEQRIERVLIRNSESLELRFLDQKNQWKTSWPSASSLTTTSPSTLPKAIEITLIMGDWGQIKRLILLPNND